MGQKGLKANENHDFSNQTFGHGDGKQIATSRANDERSLLTISALVR